MAVAYAGTALFLIFAAKFTLSLGLKESTYNLVTLDYLDELFQAPPLLATASYIVALEGTNHLGAAETEVARRQPRSLTTWTFTARRREASRSPILSKCAHW